MVAITRVADRVSDRAARAVMVTCSGPEIMTVGLSSRRYFARRISPVEMRLLSSEKSRTSGWTSVRSGPPKCPTTMCTSRPCSWKPFARLSIVLSIPPPASEGKKSAIFVSAASVIAGLPIGQGKAGVRQEHTTRMRYGQVPLAHQAARP